MILPILFTIDPTNVKRNDSRVPRYSRVSCNDSRNDSIMILVILIDSQVSLKWENMIKPPLI